MDAKNVFGIDLGTTYSCIAQIDKQEQAVVLRNFEGSVTTPSVVYFEDEKTAIVGEEAKNQLEVNAILVLMPVTTRRIIGFRIITTRRKYRPLSSRRWSRMPIAFV